MSTVATDPAYPVDATNKSTGLTKREYFAAVCIQSILTNTNAPPSFVADIAKKAVVYADALIQALNQ